jgi:hypothetical protein
MARKRCAEGSVSCFERGRGCGGCKLPPSLKLRVGGIVVDRKSLPLMFRVREVVVVGANLLRYSNREQEDGGWQVKPPSHVSSEEGANDGRESPPSLESRVGG